MTDTDDKKTRGDALRKAYQNANAALRDKYREEFEGLYVAEAAKLGVDYKPKPTKEQRDREALAKLLRENPSLRQELVDEISSQSKAE